MRLRTVLPGLAAAVAIISAAAFGLSQTAAPAADPAPDTPLVVATTPIITDLARNVAGERAHVRGLMPPSADPHTFEPGLRAVRDIANAALVLTNGLLLEPTSLAATVSSTAQDNTPVVPVAEKITNHGGELIPLVENASLDTVWLGLRSATDLAATTPVDLRLSQADGPGDAAAYITTTFGRPEVLFNTADGINQSDSVQLPAGAHTHVSWAFSRPGKYTLRFESGAAKADVTIAVGVDANTIAANTNADVIDSGHVDITAGKRITLVRDTPLGGREELSPDSAIIAVPSTTLQPIPGDPQFRFLGRPGTETYLLPQAVLGKHIHGEIDPHVWHDAAAAAAMVEEIRDELIRVDPAGAAHYRNNAEAYLRRVAAADTYVRDKINSIPKEKRYLVTTHHGYAYLGRAYGIKIAGFVSPNPSVEPTPRDVMALSRTLENLQVPAVFVEPTLAHTPTTLTQSAATHGVEVCPIHGDTLDDSAPTYLELMTTNADSLALCLSKR
ncbi:anchored repeat ABC transporter, substrate-binding protein [Corynebacterium mayonis]|uniref:anchored repeat ABC transporter, substrate-binding protein n=1 Tax=Corynebacterium mayonis TaxID=3062461 RepID=UPI0031403007